MNKILIISTILISFNLSAQKTGKLKDKRDGKIYPTVVIGSQTWMAENLNVSTFRNGDTILEVKTLQEWVKAGTDQQPAWCYYEFRKIQDDPVNGAKYGKLYNWYAVNDMRGLAPEGWHVSSDDDWTILTNKVGGKENAGYWLKSRNGWRISTHNGNGCNAYGFNALPAGEVINYGKTGNFQYIGFYGVFWTSNSVTKVLENHSSTAKVIRLRAGYSDGQKWSDAPDIMRSDQQLSSGYSVRCVKD